MQHCNGLEPLRALLDATSHLLEALGCTKGRAAELQSLGARK